MFDKRLLKMVPGAVRYIAADVLLQWGALLANIVLFFMAGAFLQGLLDGSATSAFPVQFALVGLVAIAVRFACQAAAQRAGQASAALAKRTVRKLVYDKLVRLGPAYRESAPTSEAVQVSVEGCEQLESYFGAYLPQLFYAVLAPVTLFFCLAPLSLPAAVALLLCVPFIPISIIAVQKIARRVMRNYWGSYTDLGGMFLESIQGLTTLKIYRADEARHRRMNEAAEDFRKATMRLLSMQLNSVTVMDLFAFGGAAVGIVAALLQFADGSASFASAFTIVFLASDFFIPLRTLGSYFHTAMGGMAAAEKMYKILDAPEPAGGTRNVDPRLADVECSGVGYSFDGKRTVLEGVDFRAPHGSFVGITGESGSGKSTLAGILAGVNSRYSGQVRIGGVDLRDISSASLRETVTTVPFSAYVFKGTVRSNLLLAKPDATDDELWGALSRCRLDGFVRGAGGLDAAVAADGGNLSGGQRQRLCFARALLHDAPIYVFDEATSNIDAESEAAILSAVGELAREKTVIMISHRLAALQGADAIYVLQAGRVAETGTHDELLAEGGAYARLWEKQAELEAFAARAAQVDVGLDAADDDASREAPAADAASRAPRRRTSISVMARLVKLTRPLFPVMLLAVALGVLGNLAASFLTVFATFGLLGIAGSWSVLSFGAIVACIAACGILRGPLRYGEQLCNHYLAFKILALVRDRVFAAMRRLAPAKLESRDAGDLVSLLTSDVELLEVFYAHTLSPVAIAFLVSLVMVCFTAAVAPQFAPYTACAYLVVGVVVPWASSKTTGTGGREVRDRIGEMNAFVLDSLRGLSETLQFGRADQRSSELDERMEGLAGVEARLKGRTAISMAATGAIVLGLDVGALLLASAFVCSGTLTFGPAAVAAAALMSSFGPVIAVANLGTTLQQTLASGARVLDVLDESPQTGEVLDGVDLGSFTGAAAHRVDFSYGGGRVLADVGLAVAPGKVVRIAGRSGAGKSTLLKLFMRFWDVDRGTVEVSGHDIRRVNTESLRAQEGFMTQETHLFIGTVRENIAIARADATDAQIRDACTKASILDLIDRLPDGLDTQVGELGDSLSGGERQRLGLARVFLHDAPFVLLDEPTSNLDALNEAAVLRALAENRAGKTILLVSHRPSAAAIADLTYSVERGRLS